MKQRKVIYNPTHHDDGPSHLEIHVDTYLMLYGVLPVLSYSHAHTFELLLAEGDFHLSERDVICLRGSLLMERRRVI
jgi:hypothetical protein